jgi:hypothetical protein
MHREAAGRAPEHLPETRWSYPASVETSGLGGNRPLQVLCHLD